jgi:ankyrin repeat protein
MKGDKMKTKKYGLLVLLCFLIGTTTYYLAAGSSSVTSIEELIKKKSPQPDHKLVEAIKKLDVKAIENALAEGANPNWNSGRQRPTQEIPVNCSAIELAIIRVCRPALFLLDPSRRIKESQEKDEELCIKILKMLFKAGAKLQVSDEDILYYPIWCGRSSVVQLLLEKDANPNASMLHNITPVELAEQYGHGDIVNMLIKNGGKPIALREAAQLRFIHLAQDNDIIGMETTLRNGAVLDGTNKSEETALLSAVLSPFYDIKRYATILYLLQKGANPNKQGLGGTKQTPLHIIVEIPPRKFPRDTSNSEYSEEINRDYERIEKAHQVYVKLTIEALLKAGAFVSTRDALGKTPLHNAAKSNNVIGANMLIEAGAKIMDKDKDGKTPLDYAESAEMIKLLKAHGAKEQ